MVVGVVLVGRVPVGVFFTVEGREEHGHGEYTYIGRATDRTDNCLLVRARAAVGTPRICVPISTYSFPKVLNSVSYH